MGNDVRAIVTTGQMRFGYRFGFNGKEQDSEVSGQGNTIAFEARIYDSRLGRFLSTDPWEFKYAWQSTYAYFKNSPISVLDIKGMGGGDETEKGRAVKKSESPYNYAKDHDMTLEQLAKANPDNFGGDIEAEDYWSAGKGKLWNINEGDILNVKKQSSESTAVSESETSEDNTLPDPLDISREIADKIRTSPFLLGGAPNPFFRADAIVGDVGAILVGAELDRGGVFILAGPDKGKFYEFKELAGGVAAEGGVGVEVGRIDYWGNSSDFQGIDIYGARTKYFLTFEEGPGLGVGLSISNHKDTGLKITTTVIQAGFGLTPFVISVGRNEGHVVPLDEDFPKTD